MIEVFLQLFSLYFASEVVSRLLVKFVGIGIGPVGISMLLMFLALHLKIVKLDKIKPISDVLVKLFPIFLIPSGVRLIEVLSKFVDNIVPILVILFITTIVCMYATAIFGDFLIRLFKLDKD